MITLLMVWINAKYDQDFAFLFIASFMFDMAIFDIIRIWVSP